ncbi:hypothetical protein [Micromonospora sp. NPDC049171]|uniref:hypothetical protein n=1 Tax=Micromonospora sp. NPDC049171 TaxID=3155770 RepID=UPI0033E2196B
MMSVNVAIWMWSAHVDGAAGAVPAARFCAGGATKQAISRTPLHTWCCMGFPLGHITFGGKAAWEASSSTVDAKGKSGVQFNCLAIRFQCFSGDPPGHFEA